MKKLLFIFPVIIIIFLASSFLTVKNIECFTQYGPCSPEFTSLISQYKNHKLLWSLSKPILSSYPTVKQVSFHRRLPSTLVINIDLRKPIGMIGNNIVDASGVVLGEATSSPLPKLLSDQISPTQIQALKILSSISPLILSQITGQLSSKTLHVSSASGPEILIDMESPSKNWYPALQLLLGETKIDGKIPRIIDLRYSAPVLTY